MRQSFMRTQDAKCYHACKLYLRRGDPTSRMEDGTRLLDIDPNLTECWALIGREHWGVDLKVAIQMPFGDTCTVYWNVDLASTVGELVGKVKGLRMGDG